MHCIPNFMMSSHFVTHTHTDVDSISFNKRKCCVLITSVSGRGTASVTYTFCSRHLTFLTTCSYGFLRDPKTVLRVAPKNTTV